MSHLATLIKRVHSILISKSLTSEERLVNVLPRVYNIAEYITYNDDYTGEEKKRAVLILDMFGLPCKVDESKAGFHDLMEKVSGQSRDRFSRFCVECGRKLKNPNSMKRGMGPVCFSRHQVKTSTAFPDKDELMDSLAKATGKAGEILE